MADAFAGAAAIAGASLRPDRAISIRIPDVPLFVPEKARLAIQQLAEQTLLLALQDTAGVISDVLQEEKITDSGLLAQSFGASPATSTGGIELTGIDFQSGQVGARIFSALPYAIVVEEGRRPGQPISRTGVDAIERWAVRKLGLTRAQAAKAKWAIARAIVHHGTEGRFYAETAIGRARPRIETMFEHLADAVARQLTRPRDAAGR